MSSRSVRRVTEAEEEIRLPELLVALCAAAVLEGTLDGRKQTRAHNRQRGAQRRMLLGIDDRVARAGFHEGFEHALVGDAQIENLADRVQRGNPSAKR